MTEQEFEKSLRLTADRIYASIQIGRMKNYLSEISNLITKYAVKFDVYTVGISQLEHEVSLYPIKEEMLETQCRAEEISILTTLVRSLREIDILSALIGRSELAYAAELIKFACQDKDLIIIREGIKNLILLMEKL
ncbi:hypothetical protein [Chromobacterium sp. ATCC 53434]|uniref:hypothetical protein n=1 Tax=Chromobacterium sp. (strain ATCC 53434 / SC 14030) TaxID=2059672 RepID=UPI0013052804|nr:hypothetical protein [Chromobacterium sp. ATCC 53434]